MSKCSTIEKVNYKYKCYKEKLSFSDGKTTDYLRENRYEKFS